MTSRSTVPALVRVLAAALVCAAMTVATSSAQTVTTGTITGLVVDQQGAVLPGASVTALHQPTGAKYEAITGADGRFQLLNVRVGGPYTVTATLSGFRDQALSNIT